VQTAVGNPRTSIEQTLDIHESSDDGLHPFSSRVNGRSDQAI
jgi:hypothetical protein